MRTIYVIGEINSEMTEKVAQELDELAGQSSKEITIKLSSSGGDMMEALAIIGLIKTCTSKVVIKAYGQVMSAAVLILAAGDRRVAHEETWFMVHENQPKIPQGDVSAVLREAEQYRAQDIWWNEAMQKYTKTTAKAWTEMDKANRHFRAEEALVLGLIDTISRGRP